MKIEKLLKNKFLYKKNKKIIFKTIERAIVSLIIFPCLS